MIFFGVYTLNWIFLRYFLKRIGSSSTEREIMWFGGILIIFLGLLIILGPPTRTEIAIAGSAFTFIWVIRSYLAKKFTKNE